MSEKMKKLANLYKARGIIPVAQNIYASVLYNIYKIKYIRFVKSLGKRDNASVFSEIYKKNLWTSGESHSGLGSEVAYTENLIKFLPEVFERFNVKTIVDAPCGDFNWMKHVQLKKNMTYIGVDIVPELVKNNQNTYGNEQYCFTLGDIAKDHLPKADILFCRDCLFHLSNKDIYLVFKNFVESDISLLLTSTHVNNGSFINKDIFSGDFRLIDLFSEPFCLPRDVHYRIEDFVTPFPPREMCLWDKEQIRFALQVMSKNNFK